MITICIPVLTRYDMLEQLLASLGQSTSGVRAFVVDNGMNPILLRNAVKDSPVPVSLHIPERRLGLAEAWNLFIDVIPEERIISNDDIVFAPGSIEELVRPSHAFVSCGFGFSCFVLRDECIRRVGRFDETISPGYAYFEDMDYLRRMRIAGVEDAVVDCGAEHHHSMTYKAMTGDMLAEHHRRFLLARANYQHKWGIEAQWDELASIGGAGANA